MPLLPPPKILPGDTALSSFFAQDPAEKATHAACLATTVRWLDQGRCPSVILDQLGSHVTSNPALWRSPR